MVLLSCSGEAGSQARCVRHTGAVHPQGGTMGLSHSVWVWVCGDGSIVCLGGETGV